MKLLENKWCVKLGLVAGRNLLKKDGFQQCANPNYWRKETTYAHYNRVSKEWFFEIC